VDLAINDAPTAIGQTTSDDNGNISVAVTIPSSVPPGTYPITATGETSLVVDTVNVTVTAATTVALTGPYELYCPGTPVGTIALNDVKTSASVSPATVSSGTSFTVTGYQTVANLPGQLASAAASLGSASISGSAVGQIDVTGATPATMATGTESFNLPIPSPVPSTGLTLTVPSSPLSLGPFTAQGSAVTVQNDSITNLTLVVSGANLALKCTAYANNSVASGIVTATPSGQPIDPVIAIVGGGAPPITPPTTPKTSTPVTAGPVTAPSKALAFTGPGPGVGVIGILGGVLVLLGLALLVLVDVPRRAVMRMAVVGPAQWQRVRGMDVSDRLTNLNPMRWRRDRNEGVPDTAATSVTAPVDPSAPAQGPATATGVEANGDRLARTTEMGRDLAVNTTRAAVRAAHWLLGK
jgi:hypothetical protein